MGLNPLECVCCRVVASSGQESICDAVVPGLTKVPEEVATTRTLVSMPSQSILGLETIVSKTRRYIDLVAGFLVLSHLGMAALCTRNHTFCSPIGPHNALSANAFPHTFHCKVAIRRKPNRR